MYDGRLEAVDPAVVALSGRSNTYVHYKISHPILAPNYLTSVSIHFISQHIFGFYHDFNFRLRLPVEFVRLVRNALMVELFRQAHANT